MALTFRDTKLAALSYDEMDSNWRFFTGSFTNTGTITAAAFAGDGSAITGVTGEWDGTHVGDASITGSLGVIGNLRNTEGYALFVRSSSIPNSVLNVRQEGSGSIAEFGGSEIADQEQIVFNLGGHITASGNISSSGDVYGITGSFLHLLGNGSQLTGIGAGLWTGSAGAISREGDAQITGSLTVTNGITGSSLSIGPNNNDWFDVSEGSITTNNAADITHNIGGDDISFKILESGPSTLFHVTTADSAVKIGGDFTSGDEKLTVLGNISSSGDVYGVTGSFLHLLGDGSQLTGVESEWDGSRNGNAEITGSLIVTSDISASEWIYASSASIGTGPLNIQIHNARESIAIGYNSLINQSATSDKYNTGVGHYALENAVAGRYNVAVGYRAIRNGFNGLSNVAVGLQAMEFNSGSFNVAIGYEALRSHDTPLYNTSIGWNALKGFATSPLTMNKNVGVGSEAGLQLNLGSENTFVGTSAGRVIGASIVSSRNTFLGYNTAPLMTRGNNNTYIGALITPSSNTGGIFDEVVLGYAATGEGNTSVRIGNTSITSTHVQVDWTITSDSRVKRNIQSGSLGLNFINKLNPVYFQTVNPAEYPSEILEARYTERTETIFNPETNSTSSIIVPPDPSPITDDKWYDGLIAQEVSSSLSEVGVTSDIWYESPVNGKQGIKYSALTIPLIKAVQELSAKVDALQLQISGSV